LNCRIFQFLCTAKPTRHGNKGLQNTVSRLHLVLTAGSAFAVPPKRQHLHANAGNTSAVFLVPQGIGEYDFVPLT
jgi:quercetin dioxygenase-like cupin family protein